MEQLIDLTTAIVAAVSQQAKAITALTELCADQQPAAAHLRALSEAQATMTKAMEIQAETVKRQRMAILDDKAGTFPCFSQLPPEIRRSIWEMALPDTRLFYVRSCSNSSGQTATPAHKPPPMRAACKEAWSVTEENGYFEFAPNATRPRGQWFNPTKDILFMSEDEYELAECDLTRVQHIGIDWRAFACRSECTWQLSWALFKLNHCCTMVIITRPWDDKDFYHRHNLHHFSLKDDDIIWSHFMDIRPDIYGNLANGVTWGMMKRELTRIYREKDTLENLGIEEKDLPEIVGMELLITNKRSS